MEHDVEEKEEMLCKGYVSISWRRMSAALIAALLFTLSLVGTMLAYDRNAIREDVDTNTKEIAGIKVGMMNLMTKEDSKELKIAINELNKRLLDDAIADRDIERHMRVP